MDTSYIPLTIVIPTPCHENWDQMSAAEQGRFCSSCQKTVVDFTDKSQQEISTFMSAHKNEHVCGRFRSSQVENDRINNDLFLYKLRAIAARRSMRRNIVRYSFMLLLGAVISMTSYLSSPANEAIGHGGIAISSRTAVMGDTTAPKPVVLGTMVAPRVKPEDTTKKEPQPQQTIKGDIVSEPVNETSRMMMGGVSYREEPKEQPKQPKQPKRPPKQCHPPDSGRRILMGKISRPIEPPPEERFIAGEVAIVEERDTMPPPIATAVPAIREVHLDPVEMLQPSRAVIRDLQIPKQQDTTEEPGSENNAIMPPTIRSTIE